MSALIGSSQTASTVAIGGLSDPLKMPQVAMSGLGPAIERDRKCVLHIAPSQALNARAMLEYASSIGAKKLGALYDSGYGTVVYNELRKLSDAYGIAFVATEDSRGPTRCNRRRRGHRGSDPQPAAAANEADDHRGEWLGQL